MAFGPLTAFMPQEENPQIKSSFMPQDALSAFSAPTSTEQLSRLRNKVAPDEEGSSLSIIKQAKDRLLAQSTGVDPLISWLAAYGSADPRNKLGAAAQAMTQAVGQQAASKQKLDLDVLQLDMAAAEKREAIAKRASEAEKDRIAKAEEKNKPTIETLFDEKTGKEFKAYVYPDGHYTRIAGEKTSDPKNKQIETLFDAEGNEIKAVINSDGTFTPIGGSKSKDKNLTQSEKQDTFNAHRISAALKNIGTVLEKDPSAATSVTLDLTSDSKIPLVSAAGRKFSNPNAQIVKNNMADAIDAILTLGTGAAYNKEQLAAERAKYTPQLGESDEVKQSKLNDLMDLYEFARQRAGSDSLPDASSFKNTYSSLFLKPNTTAPGADSPTQAPDTVLAPDVQAAFDKHRKPKN